MRKYIILLLSVLFICSCEKPLIDEASKNDNKYNVTLRFSPYDVSPNTRAAANGLDTLFTKLNLMLFQSGTETRVFDKIKTQTSSDEEFGTINLSLAEGEYDVLCVGHSSHNSATLARSKVSFTAYNGKKITDTFWVMQKITVGKEPTEEDMSMKRATSMFRLVVTDETPESIYSFKFEYSGCSADFNPWTGIGITNSSQSEIREVNDKNTYEVYTFVKGEGKLKIKVTALDTNDNIVAEKVFNDVPMQQRHITTYKGDFFDGVVNVTTGNTITLSADGAWEGENTYTF